MDQYDPYPPQGDERAPSPLAITSVEPTEDLLRSGAVTGGLPSEKRVERAVSAARSIVSTRTNASSGSRLRERIRRDMEWGSKLHWFLPSAMVGLFILGLLGALLHHWFYLSLHGKGAEDQLIMVRFGTAFAFFTKAALVGSIVLAYRQRIWYTLRTKAITVKGIDSLFSLTEDPTGFCSKDGALNAKVATLMALATWVIPLAAVLSPGALTAILKRVESGADCTIPTFNTSAQNDAIQDQPKYGVGGYELVSFNNSDPPGHEQYFGSIGFVFTEAANFAFTLKKPREIPSPCKGYNCTWNVGFDAPWYECQEKSVEEARKALDTMNWGEVSNDLWAPRERVTLHVVSDGNEYAPAQPLYRNGSDNMQGYFTGEPTIRVGYVVDTGIPVEEGSIDSNNGVWKTVFEPHWLSCDLFKASWNVTFDFTGGTQSATVKASNKRRVFEPPKMGPTHPNYRENAFYFSFGRLIRRRLQNGSGFKMGSADTKRFSDFHPLVNETTRLAIDNVKGGVEKLVLDLGLTLLTFPYLEIAQNTTVRCTKWRYENRFHYSPQGLWIGYTLSVIATLASVLIGMHSIYVNGITSDILFSKILVTTRNPTLDRLVKEFEGVCLGGDPFPAKLEQTRLMFGIIDEGTHTAFGTDEETTPMLGPVTSVRYSGVINPRWRHGATGP
ncbi:hypothetical protein HOY80DRAFT_1025565 [Tuber brumale]|nr:hypothetical protein HOY80DRAFT_1025565 [Tuber brumale]